MVRRPIEFKTVPMGAITLDKELQPRASEDRGLVRKYAMGYREGSKFPPLTCFRVDNALLLADGWHRYRAREHCRLDDAEIEIRPGDRRAAILFSREHNAVHGAPFTAADKRRAIETYLRDDEWSLLADREIGRRLGVDNKTVGKYRAELARRDDPPPEKAEEDADEIEKPEGPEKLSAAVLTEMLEEAEAEIVQLKADARRVLPNLRTATAAEIIEVMLTVLDDDKALAIGQGLLDGVKARAG